MSSIVPGEVFTVVSKSIEGGGFGSPSTYRVTATSSFRAWADGIPIWWQSSDLSVFAAASTRPRTSSISSRGTGLPAPTVIVDSNRLSTGAIIGLGIGVPFALILGLVLGFIVFRWRQKKKAKISGDIDHARHSVMTETSHLPKYVSQGNYR